MARASRAVWAHRVEQWTKSRLTGAAFTARLGVKEATLIGCALACGLLSRPLIGSARRALAVASRARDEDGGADVHRSGRPMLQSALEVKVGEL
jgi:hypothetical protein